MERVVLLWSLLLTGVFGGIFTLVARLDSYPLQQLHELRVEARQAQSLFGLSIQGSEPPLDSGRVNLPPYIGRGRPEVMLWAALAAALGAFGAWRLARPWERPLRSLADSCQALQLSQPWSAPRVEGPLQAIGRDFALMLASLSEQEEQLKEANQVAQQALGLREKLLDRSHAEFRQPLLEMRRSLQGLEPHPYLQTLERNVDILLQLVDDLADGQPHIRKQETELGAFVRDTLEPLPARLKLHESASVVVELDPLRTRQALLNLVSNGLKFSTQEVQVSWGDGWILVEDQGEGFDRAQIPDVLQEFRQLQPGCHEGVGLGLATAQRWMELQGGRLELDSQPGRGTRARLRFSVERVHTLVT